MDNNVDMNHLLTLENREHLTLTGISDVDSFNEEEINAISPCGELTIKGELLHIEVGASEHIIVHSGRSVYFSLNKSGPYRESYSYN